MNRRHEDNCFSGKKIIFAANNIIWPYNFFQMEWKRHKLCFKLLFVSSNSKFIFFSYLIFIFILTITHFHINFHISHFIFLTIYWYWPFLHSSWPFHIFAFGFISAISFVVNSSDNGIASDKQAREAGLHSRLLYRHCRVMCSGSCKPNLITCSCAFDVLVLSHQWTFVPVTSICILSILCILIFPCFIFE